MSPKNTGGGQGVGVNEGRVRGVAWGVQGRGVSTRVWQLRAPPGIKKHVGGIGGGDGTQGRGGVGGMGAWEG